MSFLTIVKAKAIVERASVYRDSAFSVPNDAWTAIPFNLEHWDTDTMHDTVTNSERLTCKAAGVYISIGNVSWAANNVGNRMLGIRKNNSDWVALVNDQALSSGGKILLVATVMEMAVNEYVELMVWQNRGGNLDVIFSAGNSPEFMLVRII